MNKVLDVLIRICDRTTLRHLLVIFSVLVLYKAHVPSLLKSWIDKPSPAISNIISTKCGFMFLALRKEGVPLKINSYFYSEDFPEEMLEMYITPFQDCKDTANIFMVFSNDTLITDKIDGHFIVPSCNTFEYKGKGCHLVIPFFCHKQDVILNL